MASAEYGPSWHDCATATDVLIHQYGRSISYHLMPAVKRLDGLGFGSWVVGVHVSPRKDGQGDTLHAQASFGRGGRYTTAPAALLACITDVIARLDSQRARAEQSAMF